MSSRLSSPSEPATMNESVNVSRKPSISLIIVANFRMNPLKSAFSQREFSPHGFHEQIELDANERTNKRLIDHGRRPRNRSSAANETQRFRQHDQMRFERFQARTCISFTIRDGVLVLNFNSFRGRPPVFESRDSDRKE